MCTFVCSNMTCCLDREVHWQMIEKYALLERGMTVYTRVDLCLIFISP